MRGIDGLLEQNEKKKIVPGNYTAIYSLSVHLSHSPRSIIIKWTCDRIDINHMLHAANAPCAFITQRRRLEQ